VTIRHSVRVPHVSTIGSRVAISGLFAAFGIGFATLHGTGGYVGAAACAVLLVRATRLGFSCDSREVVVRNMLSSARVPISDIAGFGIRRSLSNGGPTLFVRRTDGTRVSVFAYPITRIPGVAGRRRAIVGALNDWLQAQRSGRP
jgi:hypothetical protein